MYKKIISLAILVALSNGLFANGDNLVLTNEKKIIESSEAYAFNLKLNQVSPLIFNTAIETAKLQQLEEIKLLLQKIVDNQKELIRRI